MTIRLIHSNDVTTNREDISTRYTDLFFDDETNSLILPDPTGMLETKIGAAIPAGIKTAAINTATGNLIITKTDGTTIDAGKVTAATTSSAGPVVGSAPNPMAPIVVTSPPGYKAANIDDGVELSLDTLAVQLAPSGARGPMFRVTSGTMNVRIAGQIYWTNNGNGIWESKYWAGDTLTTTWQQPFGWSFPWAGDQAVVNIQDLTNRRFYRMTMVIGPGYKKNTIIMERLV